MGPILQFIRPHDVFNTETLTVLNNATKRLSCLSATITDTLRSPARPSPCASSILEQWASAA